MQLHGELLGDIPAVSFNIVVLCNYNVENGASFGTV
jgi:hypothetical protein